MLLPVTSVVYYLYLSPWMGTNLGTNQQNLHCHHQVCSVPHMQVLSSFCCKACNRRVTCRLSKHHANLHGRANHAGPMLQGNSPPQPSSDIAQLFRPCFQSINEASKIAAKLESKVRTNSHLSCTSFMSSLSVSNFPHSRKITLSAPAIKHSGQDSARSLADLIVSALLSMFSVLSNFGVIYHMFFH